MPILRIDFKSTFQAFSTIAEISQRISEILSLEVKPLFSNDEWLIYLIKEFSNCQSHSSYLVLKNQLLNWSITHDVCIEDL
jgi:hypothetical protein